MGNNWTQAKLGDYVESCLGKMLDKNKNTGEYHPYLGNSNVRWGEFELDDLSEMKFEAYEHDRYGIIKGDLIICEGGEPGRCAIWEGDTPNMKIQKALHRVRPLPGLDSEYLYYWFLFSTRAGYIDPFFTGTTIKHLTGKALKEIPIKIPPLKYQQDGAKLLRGLDKKITLNQKTNQTLEQMAQTLFKSWFVDFDPVVDNALDAGFFEQDLAFPDELLRRAEARSAVREHCDFKPLPEATRQLFPAVFEECAEPSLGLGGWVPQGWQALQFGEFIHRKSVGKKYDQKSASAVGKIPILDQGKSGVIGYHDDEPGVRASLDSPVVVFANHTCYMRLISFDFSAIQNVLPFTGKDVDTTWAFYATQDRVRFSEYKGHWPDFVIEKTIVPSLVLTTKFREDVDSLIRSVRCNELQNQTLINLRDTLLPKLISGELHLDNIEADLAKEGVD